MNKESSVPASDRIFTPANIITVIRICLVPAFVVALLSPWPDALGFPDLNDWKCWIAAGIFILISGTDWLDGYLARKRNEVTDFGKFMDPLADKILVAAALLALIELDSLPSWVVLVILAREFIVSGVRMVAASKGEVIAASWYGKFKTVFQMIAIVMFTVKGSHFISDVSPFASEAFYILSWIVMIIALILTVFSMCDYIYKARHLLGFRRHDDKAAQIVSHAVSEDESRVERILSAARAQGLTVGTAESCTGGMIAAVLTAVPGSSDVVRGSIVSYCNDVKAARLNVSQDVLDTQGAVCEDTACQMAQGALSALGVDIAVSVTGVAGPGGGTDEIPVGTVWIGIASKDGVRAEVHHFSGDRDEVRTASVDAALDMIIGLL